ncbi:hypothetical protein ACTJLC_17640 [Paraburkholderia sp. 22099]|jgi:hypothetical protein|uniref:PXPV repeat-containing protein n=1 Tax=Paraburkholderia terricola TaxID=169427 RepID=A0A1M6QM15_9BURK|nr:MULTISPECIES: hypothetical protein [Paraburkholderia]ORC52117.1 hypothetical protein B2G74_05695 [Burkholderia sp. A27]AXE95370.1 hypothetical protein CUJ90_23930 [Paraburkholderia terricola]MDR6411009.1 hypothetical protein [Paraburkholderia terricola]MDR6447005.1 hypothetical protein [Paraburkholderia terricola]MDR6483310.1 hypothetical protein [Paraburkholderia terricola]
MLKRAIVFAALGLAAAGASTAALAGVDVGVFVNTPGPMYAPPPVIYAPPPPVVYSPPVVYAPQPVYSYGDGHGYRGDYYRERRWHHDHGHHRGWDKHGRGW